MPSLTALESHYAAAAELLANAGQISREIEILNNLSDLNSLDPTDVFP